MTWRTQAACLGHDPELWFPSKGDFVSAQKAKAVCAGCPVRAACLEDALTEIDDLAAGTAALGVRGGLSPRELVRVWNDRRKGVA